MLPPPPEVALCTEILQNNYLINLLLFGYIPLLWQSLELAGGELGLATISLNQCSSLLFGIF